MKKYLLEFVVFTTGAVVMILELCGSRILAPYIGTSITVWTSLIGIILGSLSLGYYLGGKAADRKNPKKTLSTVIFLSALFIAVILLLRTPFLQLVDRNFEDLMAKAVVSTIVLFAFPSITLGMVTPLATKLKLESLKTAGGVVGNLYAISTIGSIVGTFLAGFVLLLVFPIPQILLGLSLILFALSAIISLNFRWSGVFVIVITIAMFLSSQAQTNSKVYESQYGHIEIFTFNGTKYLQIDNKYHSAMYIDNPELVFDYTKYYHLARHINPEAKRILMIGGGAYSVPKDFLRLYQDIEVDVVEIDPLLTELAYKEFGLQNDPRLTIYHEDGRTFLNRESRAGNEKYDAILIDAFTNFSIPFHLTTKEAVQNMYGLLTENGVVITNIISSIEGEKGGFLQAEYHTYSSAFPMVGVIPVRSYDGEQMQNLMLVGFKNMQNKIDPEQFGFLRFWGMTIEKRPILTDDFAPVDQYVRSIEM